MMNLEFLQVTISLHRYIRTAERELEIKVRANGQEVRVRTSLPVDDFESVIDIVAREAISQIKEAVAQHNQEGKLYET